MKFRLWVLGSLALATTAFAQSDRGTITGTIADPAGALVANAPVQVRNVDTGAGYQAASSSTGNYTLPQLPAGRYEMSVTVPGFKKYVRQNLTVDVAQTYRIDIALEVGSATESVTVTEVAPLLKTESGELSHNVTSDTLNNLPVLSIGAGAGSAGIRNPYAVMNVIPGSAFAGDSYIRVNGMPSNTMALRVEGQDSTNNIWYTQSYTQPSVDAIQEFAVETSNYAAEFGRAGGGVFNVTMKSGTNLFHGTVYDYFVNEALNAGVPFTNNGDGSLLRPRQRRNDYGFTIGGPVVLPKLYNGHDKLFFFFNFEQFRETVITNNVPTTVPTLNYRNGNFSQALTGRSLGTDQLGRPISEDTIYDPNSDFTVNGVRERNPFPGNMIPTADLDPVALKLQSLIPLPTSSGLINNYLPTYANPKNSFIPSLKVDYLLGPKSKVSGYWSRTGTTTPNNNALPQPITTAVPAHDVAETVRLNFDQTFTPTLLLHLGAGLLEVHQDQPDPSYNPAQQLGLTGTYAQIFPVFQGLSVAQGGMANMGRGNATFLTNYKPTANTSLTWVHSNHTFKAGGEMVLEGYVSQNQTYANGWLIFTNSACSCSPETGLPSLNGVSLPGGVVGFPYASFLLGAVDNGYTAVPTKTRVGSHAFSWFIQDTWKVTRKLTVDYGLRYDFQTYLKEEHGFYGIFSPSTPNPSVGGRLGAVIYEGSGGGRCNCQFAHNYPFAYGPRIGIAYQIAPKTVLRTGAGVSYYRTDENNELSYSTGSEFIYATPSYGDPAFLMRNGMPYKVTFPNFDPGAFPLPGTTSGPSQLFDENAGRPARILQWSFGLQREVAHDVVVEATYVGNRGAYWPAPIMNSGINSLTPQILSQAGLSLSSPADLQLLTTPINSSLAQQRGFAGLPYSSFPATQTVAQTLRPFPQFGNLSNWHYVPDGDTWYESLQTKATKRFSHGLDMSSSFTWSKQLTIGTENNYNAIGAITPVVNDVHNRRQDKYLSGFDQPFLFIFSGTYTTPKLGSSGVFGKKAFSWAARDWQWGAVLRYASGLPLESPLATNGLASVLYQGTFMNRVPGVPLFTQDLNCHCFNPNTTFVLNPAAWTNPPAGQFGTAAAYYSDYRQQRRPMENMSLARLFHIKERATVQIRAEFTNIFNRTEPNTPTSTNALATQTRNAAGQTTGGFGFINTATTFASPRQGTLVARFQF